MPTASKVIAAGTQRKFSAAPRHAQRHALQFAKRFSLVHTASPESHGFRGSRQFVGFQKVPEIWIHPEDWVRRRAIEEALQRRSTSFDELLFGKHGNASLIIKLKSDQIQFWRIIYLIVNLIHLKQVGQRCVWSGHLGTFWDILGQFERLSAKFIPSHFWPFSSIIGSFKKSGNSWAMKTLEKNSFSFGHLRVYTK